MSEFTKGIFNLLKDSSLTLAIIYTLGHIVISASVVTIVTGASLFEAGVVALLGPTINGVWYYLLDKLWSKYII